MRRCSLGIHFFSWNSIIKSLAWFGIGIVLVSENELSGIPLLSSFWRSLCKTDALSFLNVRQTLPWKRSNPEGLPVQRFLFDFNLLKHTKFMISGIFFFFNAGGRSLIVWPLPFWVCISRKQEPRLNTEPTWGMDVPARVSSVRPKLDLESPF